MKTEKNRKDRFEQLISNCLFKIAWRFKTHFGLSRSDKYIRRIVSRWIYFLAGWQTGWLTDSLTVWVTDDLVPRGRMRNPGNEVDWLANKAWMDTYSPSFPQIATAALRSTSEPSNKIESHTRSTVSSGRHVANSVKNHCMVNTLIKGGSYMAFEPFCDKACACKLSRCLESLSSFARIKSRSTAMSTDSARRLFAK